MAEPRRVQLRRTKGWRKPEGVVVVSRPSRWGNPFRDDKVEGAAAAFARHLAIRRRPPAGWVDLIGYPTDDEIREALAGRDLACWCSAAAACHADVLLRIANGDPGVTLTPRR